MATHAADFGPGGGIGPLTAEIFEGHGVIDKGKGDAEFFSSLNVKFKEWWNKKGRPAWVAPRKFDVPAFFLTLLNALLVANSTSTLLFLVS